MEEDIKHYKLGDTIQEFEELFGNVPINDINKIKNYLFNEYVPKSKIEDKIEELKETADEDNLDDFIRIQVLEEILKEEK